MAASLDTCTWNYSPVAVLARHSRLLHKEAFSFPAVWNPSPLRIKRARHRGVRVAWLEWLRLGAQSNFERMAVLFEIGRQNVTFSRPAESAVAPLPPAVMAIVLPAPEGWTETPYEAFGARPATQAE